MPAPRTRPRETRSAILAKHAALDVNTLIKARTYIRKADLVLKQVREMKTWAVDGHRRRAKSTSIQPTQADTYRNVGNEDQLYYMLVRFARCVHVWTVGCCTRVHSSSLYTPPHTV